MKTKEQLQKIENQITNLTNFTRHNVGGLSKEFALLDDRLRGIEAKLAAMQPQPISILKVSEEEAKKAFEAFNEKMRDYQPLFWARCKPYGGQLLPMPSVEYIGPNKPFQLPDGWEWKTNAKSTYHELFCKGTKLATIGPFEAIFQVKSNDQKAIVARAIAAKVDELQAESEKVGETPKPEFKAPINPQSIWYHQRGEDGTLPVLEVHRVSGSPEITKALYLEACNFLRGLGIHLNRIFRFPVIHLTESEGLQLLLGINGCVISFSPKSTIGFEVSCPSKSFKLNVEGFIVKEFMYGIGIIHAHIVDAFKNHPKRQAKAETEPTETPNHQE